MVERSHLPLYNFIGAMSLTKQELVEQTGVPAGTIARYIQSGAVDRPNGVRSAARYTKRHIEQIRAVKAALAKGYTLADAAISHQYGSEPRPSRKGRGGAEADEELKPATFLSFRICPGVFLMARNDLSASQRALVKRLLIRAEQESSAWQQSNLT